MDSRGRFVEIDVGRGARRERGTQGRNGKFGGGDSQIAGVDCHGVRKARIGEEVVETEEDCQGQKERGWCVQIGFPERHNSKKVDK